MCGSEILTGNFMHQLFLSTEWALELSCYSCIYRWQICLHTYFLGAFKKYAIINTVSKEEVSFFEIRHVSFLDRLCVERKVDFTTENGPLAFSKTEPSFLVQLFDCKLKWVMFFLTEFTVEENYTKAKKENTASLHLTQQLFKNT